MEQALQRINAANKLEKWAGRVAECRGSGQTVREWCRENGICEQTYYRWQRRLYELARQGGQFAEITPAPAGYGVAVSVRIGGITADIHTGADAATVETVLRVLRTC